MKIKFKTSVYMYNVGSYAINSVADIEEKLASKLVSQGLAIPMEEPKKEKPKAKTTKKKLEKEGE